MEPLPNLEQAVVPKEKITDYLLSERHPSGRGKAKFFKGFGFSPDQWEVLADALKRHAGQHGVTRTEASPFGTRYVVEGMITTPIGRSPQLRAVWFIREGRDVPHLATAYPLDKPS
ncbi:DUF6883 domain-containing protein [Salisaeta longa]|uniref:DUF6883 domain-containing protein n=1 Tax=Salisaeta longa TaxID=503170 RepID=UPI0003B62D9C|nr:DUF6883 domain-containing protein [Salisaeta longa]